MQISDSVILWKKSPEISRISFKPLKMQLQQPIAKRGRGMGKRGMQGCWFGAALPLSAPDTPTVTAPCTGGMDTNTFHARNLAPFFGSNLSGHPGWETVKCGQVFMQCIDEGCDSSRLQFGKVQLAAGHQKCLCGAMHSHCWRCLFVPQRLHHVGHS